MKKVIKVFAIVFILGFFMDFNVSADYGKYGKDGVKLFIECLTEGEYHFSKIGFMSYAGEDGETYYDVVPSIAAEEVEYTVGASDLELNWENVFIEYRDFISDLKYTINPDEGKFKFAEKILNIKLTDEEKQDILNSVKRAWADQEGKWIPFYSEARTNVLYKGDAYGYASLIYAREGKLFSAASLVVSKPSQDFFKEKVLNKFSDIEEITDHFAVREAMFGGIYLDIINGTSDSKLSPKSGLTRGMVSTFIKRLESPYYVAQEQIFEDTKKGAWYYDSVGYCFSKGYIKGYNSSEFKPEKEITIGELCTIMLRYIEAKYDIKPLEEINADYERYKDLMDVDFINKGDSHRPAAIYFFNKLRDCKLGEGNGAEFKVDTNAPATRELAIYLLMYPLFTDLPRR